MLQFGQKIVAAGYSGLRLVVLILVAILLALLGPSKTLDLGGKVHLLGDNVRDLFDTLVCSLIALIVLLRLDLGTFVFFLGSQ